MKSAVNKKFKYFIGIDVSKDFFDYTLMKGKNVLHYDRVNNHPDDIRGLVEQLGELDGFKLSSCVFGMEHTGIYCNLLLNTLEKLKANIVHENALIIRNSLGMIRGKNDKIDSERIALFLYKSKEELMLWQSKRDIILRLQVLSALRTKLDVNRTGLQTAMKEMKGFMDEKMVALRQDNCERTLTAIKADIEDLDRMIRSIWMKDERLKQLMGWITSVPSVGEKTAIQIIIKTNEFWDISDPRKFACFSGIAPFPYESGKSIAKKSRVSKISDRKMKSLLHMCALSAVSSDAHMRSYFERKTKVDGKNGMSVMNAIRFKLVLRVFACVNGCRNYEKDYVWQKTEEPRSGTINLDHIVPENFEMAEN